MLERKNCGGNKLEISPNLLDVSDSGTSAYCHDSPHEIRVLDIRAALHMSGGERKPRPSTCLNILGGLQEGAQTDKQFNS